MHENQQQVNLGCCFPGTAHLAFGNRISHWDLEGSMIMLNWLAVSPRDPASVPSQHLGYKNTPPLPATHMVWGSNSELLVCTVDTLPPSTTPPYSFLTGCHSRRVALETEPGDRYRLLARACTCTHTETVCNGPCTESGPSPPTRLSVPPASFHRNAPQGGLLYRTWGPMALGDASSLRHRNLITE